MTGSARGCGRSSRRTACGSTPRSRPRGRRRSRSPSSTPTGAATYRFYTDGTSAPALTPEQALAALPDDVDFLHVGTLGLVMEPIASALQAVVEAVADRALVMVDPNCRPTFIADRDAYRGGLAKTLRHAHVVKVSGDDLEYLTPGVGVAEAARALGVPVALVTLGGDGALIVTADGRVHGGGAEDHGRRHDRRRRRVRRRLHRLLGARRAEPRRAGGRGCRAGGDALCVRRRRPDVRASGCVSAEAFRPRRRPLSRGQARARAASGAPRGRSAMPTMTAPAATSNARV